MQYSFSRINKLERFFVIAFAILLVFSGQKDVIFLMAAAPSVTTGSASSITKTSASLSGSISGNGGSDISAAGYNYGLTASYGSSVSATTSYVFSSVFGTAGSGSGQFSNPYGIAFDSSGNMYVADAGNDRVQKFDSLGAWVADIGVGVLDEPRDIIFDSSGNMYVADTGNFSIKKFNTSNVLTDTIGASGSAEGEFSDTFGLAIDSSDNIYVSDSNNHRVQKFNSAGVFQLMFGWGVDTGASALEVCTSSCQTGTGGSNSSQFNQPIGIDIDSGGTLYIADYTNNRIHKFSTSGAFINSYTTSGSGNTFNQPVALFIDDFDNVYITEAGNDRVQKFDTSVSYITKFGSNGSGNGQFDFPLGLGVDNQGNIFVSDYTLNRVQKFTTSIATTGISGLTCGTTYHFQAFATNSDGTTNGSDATFDTLSCEPPDVDTISAIGLTSSDATLRGEYIDMPVKPGLTRGFEYGTTTSYGQTISENGNEYVSQFGSAGTGNGEFNSPQGIALDSSGNIYVSDLNNNRIQKFDSSGNWILNITGIANGGNVNLSSPVNIYIDSSDNVYVADIGNGRIQKFNSAGVFQLEFGSGFFGATFSVAVDSSGIIYVTDYENSRVQRFDSSGVYVDDFAAGEVVTPYSIDFDSSGNVYIADTAYAGIRVFDSSGTNIPPDLATGALGGFFSIQIDSNDNLYVADQDNNRIRKYSTAGTLLYDFGSVGTGNGELNSPVAAYGDSSGNIFVADTNNNRIQIFNSIFSIDIAALNSCATYNYRAFATNAEGTGYGDNMTFTTSGCGGTGGPTIIYGCTNSVAQNYNPNANQDDGSCLIFGCMDRDASNFDPTANVAIDDYCIYDPGAIPGCTDQNAGNYNSSATVDDGSCLYGVFGCMDPLANNYNPLAEFSNGSCLYDGNPPPESNGGCTNSGAINYDASADYDDGSCNFTAPLIYGCMDVSASNFDSNANADDGSCEYIGAPDENPISQIIGVVSSVAGNVPKEILTGVSVIGIVGPGIILNFLQPGLLAGLISIPIRLWNLIPVLMGYRRKKRPWGTVFDSVTKQPLDPVYVTLSTLAGVEQGTSITDLDGRYGFLAEAGSYKISANKDNYIFPSTKLAGKTADELYDSLYFGEPIELTEKEGVIYKNIPMDSINFNWNEFAKAKNKKLMKFYSKRDLFFARTAKTLFIAGFVSSLALFLVNNSTLNTVILSLYALILILRLFGIKPKQSGYAYDTDGTPLSYGIIKLFSSELNREVGHTVIGKTGRYYMLAPNGNYYMKVFRKTDETSYEDILVTDTFRVKGGYVRKVIRA